jgi:hypothetical protein
MNKPKSLAQECADFYYQAYPAPDPEKPMRFRGRDEKMIKTMFSGTLEEFKEFCIRGWNHKDQNIRRWSRYSLVAFLKEIPGLRREKAPEKLYEPSLEERQASIKAFDSVVSTFLDQMKKNQDPKK